MVALLTKLIALTVGSILILSFITFLIIPSEFSNNGYIRIANSLDLFVYIMFLAGWVFWRLHFCIIFSYQDLDFSVTTEASGFQAWLF